MPDVIQALTDEPMPFPEYGADATIIFSLDDGDADFQRVTLGQVHLLFDHERAMSSAVADVTRAWVEERSEYKALMAELDLYDLSDDPFVQRARYLIREKRFRGYSVGTGYVAGKKPLFTEYEEHQFRLRNWGLDEISMTPTPRNVKTATVDTASGAGAWYIINGIVYSAAALSAATWPERPMRPAASGFMTDVDVARGLALYIGGIKHDS